LNFEGLNGILKHEGMKAIKLKVKRWCKSSDLNPEYMLVLDQQGCLRPGKMNECQSIMVSFGFWSIQY
jgi:hypothetical protein